MEGEEQRRYYELGETYWWLRGKYDLVWRWARPRVQGARDQVVLDLGCGPGNLLRWISGVGFNLGLDSSYDALQFARARGYRSVVQSSSERIPLRDGSVSAIFLLDVLEHLADDAAALAEVHRVLRPSGRLIISVPAFQLLWGDHDTRYGHFRRYRTRELRAKLAKQNFTVRECFYFELIFFPALLAFRRIKSFFPGSVAQSDDFVPLPSIVNSLLTGVLIADGLLARLWRPEFGVTIYCAAEKVTPGDT